MPSVSAAGLKKPSAGARACFAAARDGSIVDPAVLTGTKPEMKVNALEIFGPVVTVEPYQHFDEALRRINNSNYGLQAGIFTRDANSCSRPMTNWR